ncbi:MAG: hypothetical protein BWK80_13140 [Desulfobacteraceae bacterium IS3]|nr:MAG: hypothetical protein BWK80_13140 [Desulfobacteraceae bacterium IS3]
MNLRELLKNKSLVTLKPLRSAFLPSLCATGLCLILYPASATTGGKSELRFFFLFILTFLMYVIFYLQFNKDIAHSVEHLIAEIRLKLIDRVRLMDLHFFEKADRESIYTVLTLDAKAVAEISHLIAVTIQAVLTLAVSLGYMGFMFLPAAVLIVISGALVGMIYAFNQILIRDFVYKVRDREKELFEAVGHLLDGFKELRVNNRKSDDFFHRRFKQSASQLRALRLQSGSHLIDNYTLTYSLWQAMLIAIAMIMPFTGIVSGNLLMTFVGLVLDMPISLLIGYIPRILAALISIQRLYELEKILAETQPEVWEETASATEGFRFENCRYEQIVFRYEQEERRAFSLGPLNLSVQTGEIVFITGGNGSGKTTLIKLLTGLYPLHSGQFFLNGAETDIRNCRGLFAAVFYDFHLFDRLYGLKDIDADKVNGLIKLMGLENKVRFEGNRFSTLDLSTGQRKRLAMVAAMMEDKPVYVFDEWAAEQDPHFRQYFYETLLPSFKAQGKTVIAVTHDDRYFHVADRVIKLEYGQLLK